jgi:hypothetical protein
MEEELAPPAAAAAAAAAVPVSWIQALTSPIAQA